MLNRSRDDRVESCLNGFGISENRSNANRLRSSARGGCWSRGKIKMTKPGGRHRGREKTLDFLHLHILDLDKVMKRRGFELGSLLFYL